MFEAKILQGSILKKIIEAIRELVTDANLDCNERGITMQVANYTPLRKLKWKLTLQYHEIIITGDGLVSRVPVRCRAEVGGIQLLSM